MMTSDYIVEWVDLPTFVEKIADEEKVLTVMSERFHLNETLRQFFDRKWKEVKEKDPSVKGFYVYDAQPIGPVVNGPKDVAMMVRYVVKRGELVDGYKMK